jgi:hypothetical protein
MTPLPASAHLYTAVNGPEQGEPAERVARDRAAWEAAWQSLHRGLAAGPAPAVDFGRDMVALVALGDRPTGGYAVRIEGTSVAPDGALLVHVVRTRPGPTCMLTQATTSPVDVARVPRAAGAVRFVSREEVTPC